MTSSMSTGSSSTNGFDLRSEQGIVLLLAVVRQSAIDTNEKRFLRDLVMSYAQSKGDKGLRDELTERISHYQLTPKLLEETKTTPSQATPETATSATDTESQNSAPITHAGFSSGRSVPVFTSSQKTSTEKPTSPVVNQAPKATVPTVEVTKDVPTPEVAMSSVPTQPSSSPSQTTSENSNGATTTTGPASSQPPAPIPAQTQPSAVSESESPSTPKEMSPTGTGEPGVSTYTDNPHLARIQAIKSDINKRIGNPVNLVDINNQVGREYMSALLDAMKSLANGTSPEAAMSRLESAYQAAIAVTGTDTTSQSLPATPKTPTAPKINPIIPSTPPSPDLAATDPAAAKQIEIHAEQKNEPASASIQPSTNSVPVPTPPPSPSVSETVDKRSLPIQPSSPSNPHTSDAVPITSSKMQVASVADATPLRKISEVPLASERQSVPSGTDPLFTQEIDNGLDQLLSEWPLFSKSGLLGRGPNRREHPLFIQLANMPIPLILAGRFEGATPQVMQSISDYMNGWRYEQGLVYDNDESFEHFLRRVIRHILNWQRKQKTV